MNSKLQSIKIMGFLFELFLIAVIIILLLIFYFTIRKSKNNDNVHKWPPVVHSVFARV